jgi:hypothetical protein
MIVVIADDVSGAAELAGAAVQHGLSAEVQTTFSAETSADVICLTTETRSLTPAHAADVVRNIGTHVVSASPEWIFKKCDSVLRGPVLAEARALAEVAGKKHIVIAPANPSRDRTIRDGTYFVSDQALHETAFSRDPDHPRLTSRVEELLGGDLADVTTPDAESQGDMTRIATGIDEQCLAVGALDLFIALLHLREAPRAATGTRRSGPRAAGLRMLVCGSAAGWPNRRAIAMQRGIATFTLVNDPKAIVQGLESSHEILMGIGEGPETRGISSAALVSTLAQSVADVLRQTVVTDLLLEGGATTAAVMRTMGWTRLRATEISLQGMGVFEPDAAQKPRLLIKPGSYPWPEEIWPLYSSRQNPPK